MKTFRFVFLGLMIVAFGLFSSRFAIAQPTAMKRVAVIVGANDPPPGRQGLRFAHDDANEMASVLEQVGGFAPGDVTVLLDPHPTDLMAAFDAVAKTVASAQGNALFVFYYSGHSDGQSLFPHGETLALADVRQRVEGLGAHIRVGSSRTAFRLRCTASSYKR